MILCPFEKLGVAHEREYTICPSELAPCDGMVSGHIRVPERHFTPLFMAEKLPLCRSATFPLSVPLLNDT